jgi:DMSO/TMAO reductase YedYZ molybdopterin-dependent catalytic subunit
MRRPSLARAALLAAMTSIPLVALLYLGMAYAGLPFVPFDLFDWLARVLPGRLITTTIDSMVGVIQVLGMGPISSAAKTTEQAMGIVFFIVGMIVIAVVLVRIVRRTDFTGQQAGVLAGLVALVLALVLETLRGGGMGGPFALMWLTVLLLGWGIVYGKLLGSGPESRTETRPTSKGLTRRGMIAAAGVSAAVTLSAWGLGRFFTGRQEASGAGQPLQNLPGSSTDAPGTTSINPAPGTRPAITSNADFYRIDIDTRPPVIQGKEWSLKIEGLFEKTDPLDLGEIMAYPPVTETITQACISNPIGGDLISTTRYTGARLRAVLADLELAPAAKALELHSADGFYEFVTMRDMLDSRTLLVYGMNGKSLPTAHGFPLRIYIPNHYGMKQPKWITRMKAVDHEGEGFWVKRGWSRQARPHIISIIDAVATEDIQSGSVPVGGIAWAGDRGISKVEVQVDDGSWSGAEILEPTLGPLAWVLWRFDWPVEKGHHTFRVRATDGTGALQVGESTDTFPDGATGYDSRTVDI